MMNVKAKDTAHAQYYKQESLALQHYGKIREQVEQLIDVCGVGYYDFRDFLNNLEDEDILEEIDEYVVNSRENLINKYKTMHTDLMKEFESNNLVNVWEMEMLRTKLEMVTTFLKDLRSDRHV